MYLLIVNHFLENYGRKKSFRIYEANEYKH